MSHINHRFSIQAFSSRCRHPKYDEETTAVKTPEESSASMDNIHADVPTTINEEETYASPLHSAVASAMQRNSKRGKLEDKVRKRGETCLVKSAGVCVA